MGADNKKPAPCGAVEQMEALDTWVSLVPLCPTDITSETGCLPNTCAAMSQKART